MKRVQYRPRYMWMISRPVSPPKSPVKRRKR